MPEIARDTVVFGYQRRRHLGRLSPTSQLEADHLSGQAVFRVDQSTCTPKKAIPRDDKKHHQS